jgi:hypothetical protein
MKMLTSKGLMEMAEGILTGAFDKEYDKELGAPDMTKNVYYAPPQREYEEESPIDVTALSEENDPAAPEDYSHESLRETINRLKAEYNVREVKGN